MIFLEPVTTPIKTDQKYISSHCYENYTNKIKTTEEVHQNIKNKSIKYNVQIKQAQTLQK